VGTELQVKSQCVGSQPKAPPGGIYSYQTKLICLSQEGLQIAKEKDPLHDQHPSTLRLWYLLVMQFCARRITFEEDSLSAVSGLAKEVNRHIGKEYLAGIWAHDIRNGLLWSAGAQASYPSTYVAPSWSWASIKKGRLVHPACMPMTEKSYLGQPVIIKPAAKILETHITYAGGDEFGPVVSGKLRINAPFKMTNSFAKNEIRLPWVEDTVSLSGEELEPFLYKLQSSTITCWLDARLEGDYAVLYSHLGARGAAFVHIASLASSHVLIPGLNNYSLQEFTALQHKNWALILEPAVGDTGEWKRIGVARIADELIDGWQSRDFAII